MMSYNSDITNQDPAIHLDHQVRLPPVNSSIEIIGSRTTAYPFASVVAMMSRTESCFERHIEGESSYSSVKCVRGYLASHNGSTVLLPRVLRS